MTGVDEKPDESSIDLCPQNLMTLLNVMNYSGISMRLYTHTHTNIHTYIGSSLMRTLYLNITHRCGDYYI